MKFMKKPTRSLIVVFTSLVFLAAPAICQKMSADEVISKHLNSVGDAADIAGISNLVLAFDTTFKIRGSAGILVGKSIIVSMDTKTLWGMNFESPDYPRDRFGFDGKETKVAFVQNSRSLLGDFLYNHREILRDGLLGGSLTTSWVLRRPNEKKSRITVEGTKTVAGTEAIVLEYMPKGGSDVTTLFYFDAKTFRHIRSEYIMLRAAGQGPTVDQSAGQGSSVYKIIEDFSNFKKVGKLSLPSSYKITYMKSGTAVANASGKTDLEAEWQFTLTDFGANREIDANSFKIGG
jgi:hypothetical protein